MEIEKPTVGRIVNFYPNNADFLADKNLNNAEILPAIIVQPFGLIANITIFLPGGEIVGGWSIPHKSEPIDGYAYWDWPQRL